MRETWQSVSKVAEGSYRNTCLDKPPQEHIFPGVHWELGNMTKVGIRHRL